MRISFAPYGFEGGLSSPSSEQSMDPPSRQVTGSIKKDGVVLDSCSGNWLHHLEWDKGVDFPAASGSKKASKALKRLWDRKTTAAPSSQAVGEALPSDCRNREDLVHLKVGTL